MIYQWELSTGHQLSLSNQGAQTIVTLLHISGGGQQQTSSSLTTGTWSLPPELLVTPNGAIVKITTPTGISTIQVQGNSIQMESSHSGGNQSSTSSSTTSSTAASFTAMPPMPPIPPIPPMPPMVMRMGDMELNMGTMGIGNVTEKQRFCSQCGTPVKPTDRFCASCGHKLGGDS
jgi:hypothetical protein